MAGSTSMTTPGGMAAAGGREPSWSLWSEDLTDAQLSMVVESGHNQRLGEIGFGVELRGAGQWATARSLAAKGLGDVEDGAPNGSSLPGLYFNNEEGVRITHEFDSEYEDDEWA